MRTTKKFLEMGKKKNVSSKSIYDNIYHQIPIWKDRRCGASW